MQLLQRLQCTQRGGRQILHVSQYLTCTCFPRISMVRVLLGTVFGRCACAQERVRRLRFPMCGLCAGVQTAVVCVHGVHARDDARVREGGDEHRREGCGVQVEGAGESLGTCVGSEVLCVTQTDERSVAPDGGARDRGREREVPHHQEHAVARW